MSFQCAQVVHTDLSCAFPPAKETTFPKSSIASEHLPHKNNVLQHKMQFSKRLLLHISRKNSIFAAVLKVSDFVWCFQRLIFTYKTGVYTLWSWCSKFAVSNKFQPKQSNMDAMKNVFMQHIVCPWRTNLCAVFQTRNAIEPIVGYAGEGSYRFPTGSSLIGRDRKRKEAPRTER